MQIGNCWVSWTTSFRTRTASSSYPLCMVAKDPSLCLGPGVGRREQSDMPLDPASRSPCPSSLLSSLICPLGFLHAGKRGQVLK
uniref:Ubiquitin related modifier 1 n=1 Tax=Myotis myotis TaxID=51298 RepID=A0A7J7URZ5_MYOMY|nr:ubiquitin related modifier 1 [Myotis myotis]